MPFFQLVEIVNFNIIRGTVNAEHCANQWKEEKMAKNELKKTGNNFLALENRKGVNRTYMQEQLSGILFVAPSFIGFLVFTLIPVIASLVLSFTEWNFLRGWNAVSFNGLENFKRLFKDDWFLTSYGNNLIFTLGTIPLLIALGLVCAHIVNTYVKAPVAVRVMMFIPYIASVVAISTVWMVLFQPSYGPINNFLMAIGIKQPPGWLTSTKTALLSIMIVYVWQNIGYYLVVFMSGLKAIDFAVYEAASIDGASGVQKFFYITVPLISPTTFFLTTMGIIGSFKVFDQISVMTNGGPGNASSVMAFYIYRTAFENFEMGYANTLAWALFVLIFLVTMIQWRAQKSFAVE